VRGRAGSYRPCTPPSQFADYTGRIGRLFREEGVVLEQDVLVGGPASAFDLDRPRVVRQRVSVSGA